jgi:plasmid stability protein
MANLTITVDEDTLKRARLRALERGTSVNAILRDYLEHYAGVKSAQERALKNLLRLSKAATSSRGSKRWSRDDLHER